MMHCNARRRRRHAAERRMSGREGSDVRGNPAIERNDMSDDNRLEDSRLDADHIDRLTRELAAMRSRAEQAEAALAVASDGLYVKINQSKGTT